MRYFDFDDTPVFVQTWCDPIDEKTMIQVSNLAHLPFTFHHIALMADAHVGYGMPIGGVLAAKKVVIPNAVGSDIGCGMRAAMLHGLHVSQFTSGLRLKVLEQIRVRIPVGHRHHAISQESGVMPQAEPNAELPIVTQEGESAHRQVGTLGGGNHFIELQADQQNNIWVMIHSGSRNVGKKVADAYNRQALDLNAKWHSAVPKEWELAFLPIDSPQGKQYLQEMEWCIKFARCSRALMMRRVGEVFESIFTGTSLGTEATEIDICHNYARMEHHFGTNVMVHRKGATFAGEDNVGIIPGSQGTKSYIVRGLGNPDSFNSSSHGAGRRMGRNEAEAKLDLAAEVKKMDDQGIIHGIRHQTDLDEAPGAYKSIEDVMAAQADLVDTLVELRPLAVLKGD